MDFLAGRDAAQPVSRDWSTNARKVCTRWGGARCLDAASGGLRQGCEKECLAEAVCAQWMLLLLLALQRVEQVRISYRVPSLSKDKRPREPVALWGDVDHYKRLEVTVLKQNGEPCIATLHPSRDPSSDDTWEMHDHFASLCDAMQPYASAVEASSRLCQAVRSELALGVAVRIPVGAREIGADDTHTPPLWYSKSTWQDWSSQSWTWDPDTISSVQLLDDDGHPVGIAPRSLQFGVSTPHHPPFVWSFVPVSLPRSAPQRPIPGGGNATSACSAWLVPLMLVLETTTRFEGEIDWQKRGGARASRGKRRSLRNLWICVPTRTGVQFFFSPAYGGWTTAVHPGEHCEHYMRMRLDAKWCANHICEALAQGQALGITFRFTLDDDVESQAPHRIIVSNPYRQPAGHSIFPPAVRFSLYDKRTIFAFVPAREALAGEATLQVSAP